MRIKMCLDTSVSAVLIDPHVLTYRATLKYNGKGLLNVMMTREEFAKHIGVSTATISRAMNGTGRISDETRAMVLARMKELGYVPNHHAQQLASGRSRSVIVHHSKDILGDPYASEMARGVQHGLAERDYIMTLHASAGRAEAIESLRSMVRSRAAAGSILLVDDDIPEKVLTELCGPNHPCVKVISFNEPPPASKPHLSFVAIKEQTGVRQLARHLFEFGHRRFGVINYDWDQGFPGIAECFLDELLLMGITVPKQSFLVAPVHLQASGRAFHTLMSGPNPPTAVFVRKDEMALGALREARRMGLRVPQDVSVAGFDDLPLTQLAEPPLTTIGTNCFDLGRSAARAFFQLLDDPDSASALVRHDTMLIVRESAGPPP